MLGLWFKKKKRQRPPAPPWLPWVFLGFLALAAIGNLRRGANPVHEAIQQASHDLKPDKLFNLREYKAVLFPGSVLHMKNIKAGEGAPATFGQRVTLAYDAFLMNGQALADKADNSAPLSFRIGDGSVMPVLEQGVPGMRPGGARSIVAPANMAYGSAAAHADVPKNANYRFDLTLLAATPLVPDARDSAFRIITTRGAPLGGLACGQEARVQLTLWAVDGRKLYSTKDNDQPLIFTPGKSQVFYGLEQGVLGLSPQGARMLVVPPAFQKTLDANAPIIDFPFPKNEIVLVEVEALP